MSAGNDRRKAITPILEDRDNNRNLKAIRLPIKVQLRNLAFEQVLSLVDVSLGAITDKDLSADSLKRDPHKAAYYTFLVALRFELCELSKAAEFTFKEADTGLRAFFPLVDLQVKETLSRLLAMPETGQEFSTWRMVRCINLAGDYLRILSSSSFFTDPVLRIYWSNGIVVIRRLGELAEEMGMIFEVSLAIYIPSLGKTRTFTVNELINAGLDKLR